MSERNKVCLNCLIEVEGNMRCGNVGDRILIQILLLSYTNTILSIKYYIVGII